MAPSFAVHARRGAVALACAVAVGVAAAPLANAAGADEAPSAAASSSAPAPGAQKLPKGLYGAKDPKFDAVWRQSLAFLAQDAVGVTPATEAIDWLTQQQCADGGFPAFRPDTRKSCDPKKGEFSDATGAAVQALAAVEGRGADVAKGLDWLTRHQNKDGGWGMNPGSPSDPNSTAVVIGAFAAADKDPGKVTARSGKNPYDALRNFQLGCDAKQGERGAFGYLPDKDGKLSPNGLATADGALAAQGRGFLVAPAKRSDAEPKPLACDDGAKGDAAKAAGRQGTADAAAAYLAATLSAGDQHLTSAMPGAEPQPDYGSTADAVIALAAGGHKDAAQGPLKWLQASKSGALTWAKGDPGALAKLVLAAHAGGADPRAFGGTDLVEQLNATGPTPAAVSSDGEGKDGEDGKGEKVDKDDDGGGTGVWWVVGVGLVAGIGIGFLLSGRKKQRL
ncbi:terpene cyclase/mutase family protein [Streptomyces sp. AC563]|uniref:prenyltransferase/squalene oxidase repeat-containing protein n=1 Tax=Streptomyces buecherae TaxID=2763006 RepID=UPI00164E872B|nr:prenyltransferase/squalene oxidase repeat-containing protein [Streptomyces buecherae]MBC3992252.1 terpene cyclase/mutase family protein [Streptomyces buecherae]